MDFKVTGLIRNGRWNNTKGEWELARITPRFFPSQHLAMKYFSETIIRGSLWKRNHDTKRNQWSIIITNGMVWPEGARGYVRV